MPRVPDILLRRFPLVATASLATARRETSRFWPPHESQVIGPDHYAVTMNRVLLGDVALTFTHCTARVRVLPQGPSTEGCLIIPLSGSVEIETGSGRYRAAPGQPLFRAPDRVRRFEATPTRCLMIDLPMAVLAAAGAGTARHAILHDDVAVTIQSRAIALVRAADGSRRLQALQSRPFADRRRLLPGTIRRLEDGLVELVAGALHGGERADRSREASITPRMVEIRLTRLATSGLSIAEVARRVGLSVRRLQRDCATRGYTPLEFMRSVQLDRAHEILSRAGAADTVALVARTVGFTHLGRFSAAFQERFGELPSATLARSRQRGD